MASLSVHLAPENVLTLDAPDRESLLRELAQHGAERAGLDPELLHAPPGDAPAEASREALLAGPLRGAVLLEEREGWGLYRAPPP